MENRASNVVSRIIMRRIYNELYTSLVCSEYLHFQALQREVSLRLRVFAGVKLTVRVLTQRVWL